MPEADLEDLRQKILADLEEVDLALETQRQSQEEHPRPILRLLKGGLIGGLILAGVEWFRDYKRIVVALVAAGITLTTAVVVDQDDGLPEADPPPAPQTTHPTKPPRPSARPTATPAPPRTSPLRTLGIRAIEPTDTRTSAARPDPPRTKPPKPTPTVPSTATVTPPPITITPAITAIPTVPTILPTCPTVAVGDLLELKLCLPPR